MPLYEYECSACGQRFEIIQKFSDPPAEACSNCGQGPVHRLLSSPAIQFKGSGWYITDYSRKGKADSTGASEGKAEKADKSGTKTEAQGEGKAETKAETKAASTPASGASSSTTKN